LDLDGEKFWGGGGGGGGLVWGDGRWRFGRVDVDC